MQDTNDLELLRQYAEVQSDAAFETLVKRHVNLVYSAALRSVETAARPRRSHRQFSLSSHARPGVFAKIPFSPAGYIKPRGLQRPIFGAARFGALIAKRKRTCNRL